MLSMRHHSKRALNDKLKVLGTRKSMVQPCNTDTSVPCSNKKTAKQKNLPHKIKRLKTIKQRNQIRSQTCNQLNQHCKGERQDKRPCSDDQDCQCSCSVHFPRTEKPVARPFPARKPSIITEHRLTSIRGLFSHEVRSVNIERLIKEKKEQTHTVKETERPTTANNSPVSCVVPHFTSLVEGGETSDISVCSSKDESLTRNNLQMNSEDTTPVTIHCGDVNSTQTPKAIDNTTRSARPPDQNGMQKSIIMSFPEIHPVPESFPASLKISQRDGKVHAENKNAQKKTNKITAAVCANNDFVNSQTLVTPTGLEALNLDVPQLDSSPTIFLFPLPVLDGEKSATGEESQHSKPVFSSNEEAVIRLAGRLCDTLDPFPLQRRCPLLTDCRKVLLHHLQERHGSQLQHNLHKIHSQLSTHLSHTAKQGWPSSVQKYSDNTQISFGYTRKHDDGLKKAVQFQTDNSPPNQCLYERIYKHVDNRGASKRQRKQTWEIYSPPELQRPCRDTVSQWSVTAQSTNQHFKSQTFSQQQDFSKSQTSPWSYRLDQNLELFFPEPQKRIKAASGENRRRNSSGLPLLEQWRNDPDLDFLFQEETLLKMQTSFGPLAELKTPSPKRMSASSSVSSFFPSEGFCYEPYYQFPHPSNAFKRSENSKTRLYTPPDVEKRDYGLSQHLTSPYF